MHISSLHTHSWFYLQYPCAPILYLKPTLLSLTGKENCQLNVQFTFGEPVFESLSLSVTVGHTCHNKHIWKVSSQNM